MEISALLYKKEIVNLTIKNVTNKKIVKTLLTKIVIISIKSHKLVVFLDNNVSNKTVNTVTAKNSNNQLTSTY